LDDIKEGMLELLRCDDCISSAAIDTFFVEHEGSVGSLFCKLFLEDGTCATLEACIDEEGKIIDLYFTSRFIIKVLTKGVTRQIPPKYAALEQALKDLIVERLEDSL